MEPILFLAGPTAVGKSAVALLLAERLQGEIVSVDSMQVYHGLDIGTAKPSPDEQRRVRHHLIDVADITERFDAAQFVQHALEAVDGARSRGHLPIFCGGTGLYFKAFIEGLGTAPPADANLRSELEGIPLSELLRELAERDPVTYASIDRNNPRRVIRAVEVTRLTGRPFSEQRSDWSPKPKVQNDERDTLAQPVFVLKRSPEDLQQRIDQRVEAMFRDGLVAETEKLLERGLKQNRTAMQALGYRQVVEYLESQRSLSETIELVKTKTRQFAKRQMTWFRHQQNVIWIDVAPEETAADTADRLRDRYLASGLKTGRYIA